MTCTSSHLYFTKISIVAITTVLMTLAISMANEVLAETNSSDSNSPNMSQGIEEIIVTARKKSESYLTVPISISAFTSDMLDTGGVTSLTDLSDFSPGLHFKNQGGVAPGRLQSAIRFRGMDTGSGTLSSPSQQIGTTFVDGVYMAEGANSLSFLGIDRIEVIKGPQAALYGRSTFGGAINYVTAPPDVAHYSGEIRSMAAGDGLYDVSATFEGPIIEDKFSFRLGARRFGDGGQYRSKLDGGRLGEQQSESVIATIYAAPGERIDARINLIYQRDEDGAPAAFIMGDALSNFGAGPGLTNCFSKHPELQTMTNPLTGSHLGDFFCGKLPSVRADELMSMQSGLDSVLRSLLTSSNPEVPVPSVPGLESMGMARDNMMASFIGNLRLQGGIFEGFTLSNLSGYNKVRTNSIADFDLTAATAGITRDPTSYRTYSTEFRLSSPDDKRISWIVGANYFDAKFIRQGSGGIAYFNSGANPHYTVGGSTVPVRIPYLAPFSEEGGKTAAIFGSGSMVLSDTWTLDVEARWQRDKVSNQGIPSSSAPNPDKLSQSFTSFLPRVTLSWQPDADKTLWATFSQGNVPGFFNGDFYALSDEQKQLVVQQTGLSVQMFLEEEELNNYEVGWKQRLWDGRAYFSLTGYYMDWTNRKTQMGVIISDPNTGNYSLNLRMNSGDTDLWGSEFEGRVNVNDRLSVNANFAWARSKLKSYHCAYAAQFSGSTDCSGKRSPRFPEYSGAIALDWTDHLRNEWSYFGRIDGTYTGKAYTDESNWAYAPAYWQLNARVGVTDERLKLELFINNLLGEDKYESAGRFSNFSHLELLDFLRFQSIVVTPQERRRIGLQASYRF